MRKLILAVVLLALPSIAAAQLPPVVEGFGNPAVVAGASYLASDPGPGLKRTNLFITANVPGIKVGNIPLYVGGIGVTGGVLDPSLADIQFGISVPLLTYAFASGQWVAQGGYTKILTGETGKPDGYYLGFGFSFTSPKAMAAKRAAKAKAKAGK